jgi:hypothetical protein
MLLEKKQYGILFYICRDTGFIEEFVYSIEKMNDKYKEKMFDRIDLLKKLEIGIKEGICPDREYKICMKMHKGEIKFNFQKDNIKYKSAWQCMYCQFLDLCWKKELEIIKSKKFYIDGGFII